MSKFDVRIGLRMSNEISRRTFPNMWTCEIVIFAKFSDCHECVIKWVIMKMNTINVSASKGNVVPWIRLVNRDWNIPGSNSN